MNNMTRETYRNIKKYDYARMNAFCAKLYQQGFINGTNAEPNVEYKCGNCMKELYRTDYKFCPYCGAELIWEEGEVNER